MKRAELERFMPYRGLASGIPRALEEWPKEDFIDDRDGCLFKAIVHRDLKIRKAIQSGAAAQVSVQERLESRLESNLAVKIVAFLGAENLGKAGLASLLGHKTVSSELHKQIRRLLALGLIEMTIPEKPNSRLQKYRLTDKGRALLSGSANGESE